MENNNDSKVPFNRRDFLKATLAGVSAATLVNVMPKDAFGFQKNLNSKKSTQLKSRLKKNEILTMPGAYDALSAKIIETTGFEAFFHTGYGTSASLLAKPDVGLVSFDEMRARVKEIADAVNIPLIADGDTGYGNAINVFRTVQEYIKVGAAGMFIEDQVWPKRCGHMSGEEVIEREEMVGKINAAIDAKKTLDPDFILGARTDAIYVEGIDKAIDRAKAYEDAGADFIFLDAYENKKQMEKAIKKIKAPLLLNIIEGGKTAPISAKEAESMGFKMIIFPLATLYAATKAMQVVLKILKDSGSSNNYKEHIVEFNEFVKLIGLPEIMEMEKKYIPEEKLIKQYKQI
jgi:methylisocitrate lyase